MPLAKCLQGIVALYAPLWSPLAPFPVPAAPSLRRVCASITTHPAALRPMAEYSRISLCNTLKIAQPDDSTAPRRCGNIWSSMLKQISCASCRSAAPCLDKIRWLSHNFRHKFCLKLWADHVRPRPQQNREPVLPRFGWRQISRSWSWHFRKFDSRNVWLAGFSSSAEGLSGSSVASPPPSGNGGIVGSV